MVESMKIRIQGLWAALAALLMLFGPQALSGLMGLLIAGGAGSSHGVIASLIGALIVLCLLVRWATSYEVTEGRLVLRCIFIKISVPVQGALVCESNWPWLFRLRARDGRVHTLPLPDESVYGEPSKEQLFLSLEEEGASVLHASWRLPMGEDPAASFRPKSESFKNLMFWGKVGALLSISVIVLLMLSDHVAWWLLAPLVLLAGLLVHQQLPDERKSFLAEWRVQHQGLTLKEALDSLDLDKGTVAISPDDLEGATLVRQIGRDARGGRVSRLQLRTQTGKIGSTRWSEPVLGRDQRPPILSAGVRFRREELPAPVHQLDVSEAKVVER